MKKSLSARRVPRKIGSDEDEGTTSNGGTAETSCKSYRPPDHLRLVLTVMLSLEHRLTGWNLAQVVQRPVFKSKKSSQVRSFNGSIDGEEPDVGVITPKRSISRIAVQRNASQRSNFAPSSLPRAVQSADEDAPTYSAADLNALKQNSRSIPQESEQSLDLRDKFGSTLIRHEDAQNSAIPSATEIAEKKARRARLALESKAEEYISLDPDDPGWDEDEDGNVLRDMDGRLVLREKDKYGIQASRLVRDDEDVMEGFDDFTGEAGSRIIMGASAKRDERQTRRNEIAEQIAHAEDESGSDDDDPEEAVRNAAFEAAQTRHGTYAENDTDKQDPYAEYRAKTPPNIAPLPDLEAVLGRLRSSLLSMEARKREKESEMERLTKEKFRIRDEEVRVQQQLKEVGEKFRQIKIEKGILPRDDGPAGTIATENGATQLVRLDTVVPDDEDDQDDDEPESALHIALGSGNTGGGLGWS